MVEGPNPPASPAVLKDMGWKTARAILVLLTVAVVPLGLAVEAAAASPGASLLPPDFDARAVVAIAVMGIAGGVLLAIVTERPR